MAQRTTLAEALGHDEDAPKPRTRAPKVGAKAPAARRRRSKPVRLTIDFDPELHRALKSWALNEADNASIADVVRAMIAVLTTKAGPSEARELAKQFSSAVLEQVDRIRQD
jgi:hypothetical protein